MTFPLLRLPLLASIEVIENTDVEYLILLIQLSTRAKTLVKLSKVHIELTVSQYFIQFRKLADQEMVGRLEFSNSSEKLADIPFKPPCDLKLERHDEYQIRAYKKFLDDFVKFFKVSSVSFELGTCCSDNSLCYMEYAKVLGLKFSTARVLLAGSNGEVYRRLLKVCSNASQLLVLFDTEEEFTIDSFYEYKMQKCRFARKERGVDWFTVDHMCALINCSEVSVEGLNWSNEDFNRLLRFWMASADIPFKPPRHSKLDTKIQYQIRTYKKMLDDFVECFNVCSVSFQLETSCSDISLCYLEYAKNLGLKFSFTRVVVGGSNGKIYQNLLKNCSNASQLLVIFDTEEDFTFNGFYEYRMHRFSFITKNRFFNWFTVDQMCALVNCSEVSLTGLNWRSEDYNRFLKFWITSDGNLKSWKFWACHGIIFPRVVMDGINHRALGPHTYEIQRADGVKAEVEFSSWTCTLKVIDA